MQLLCRTRGGLWGRGRADGNREQGDRESQGIITRKTLRAGRDEWGDLALHFSDAERCCGHVETYRRCVWHLSVQLAGHLIFGAHVQWMFHRKFPSSAELYVGNTYMYFRHPDRHYFSWRLLKSKHFLLESTTRRKHLSQRVLISATPTFTRCLNMPPFGDKAIFCIALVNSSRKSIIHCLNVPHYYALSKFSTLGWC